MKRLAVLPVWLILVVTLCAAPAPKAAAPIQAEPYKIVDLSVDAGAEDLIFWDVTEEEKADIREAGAKLFFVGPPGVYHVRCRVVPVKDGKISGPARVERWLVTIGTPTPPVPPVPPPDDALTKTFKAAYATETDSGKANQAAYLTSVYKGAGALVDRADIRTNKDLLTALHGAVEYPGLGLTSTQLLAVRNAVADYLDGELGKSSSAPVDRVKAKAAFGKVAASLETLR